MAHKKAGGTTKNGRDSQGKRLGVKVFGSQKISNGSIIVRQRGMKMEPGLNTDYGRDYTIYATKDGVVKFSVKKVKKFDGRVYKKTFVHVV